MKTLGHPHIRVILLCSFLFPNAVLAQQEETVQWGCDAEGSSTCYFSIRYSSGSLRDFTMRGGARDQISEVVPGRDQYCVCVDTPTPADFGQCNNGFQGKFCKRATVQRGYNN